MGFTVAILLMVVITTLFTGLLPYVVSGLTGAAVGWMIGLLCRRRHGAIIGGLSGLLVGGMCYLALKLIVLDPYLQSFPVVQSKTPNELIGRRTEWASSAPYWIMFGTMLAAGAITGVLGTALIFILSRKRPQAKPDALESQP